MKTCRWKGADGKPYEFYIYSLPCSLDADQKGNHTYARRDDQGLWVPVYPGQGDLADRAKLANHHQAACIRRKGATHFHCHLNPREDRRLSEERDLLDPHEIGLVLQEPVPQERRRGAKVVVESAVGQRDRPWAGFG